MRDVWKNMYIVNGDYGQGKIIYFKLHINNSYVSNNSTCYLGSLIYMHDTKKLIILLKDSH